MYVVDRQSEHVGQVHVDLADGKVCRDDARQRKNLPHILALPGAITKRMVETMEINSWAFQARARSFDEGLLVG